MYKDVRCSLAVLGQVWLGQRSSFSVAIMYSSKVGSTVLNRRDDVICWNHIGVWISDCALSMLATCVSFVMNEFTWSCSLRDFS